MEIERKFLVNEDIFFNKIKLCNFPVISIEQAYLSTDDNEIRIRKIEERNKDHICLMTIKSPDFLVRHEVEFEIPYSKYKYLIDNKMFIGNILDKLRYSIPLENNLIAELDVYGNALFGLMVIEVEFITKDISDSFIKPNWFGEEITYKNKYKNKNLALNANKEWFL